MYIGPQLPQRLIGDCDLFLVMRIAVIHNLQQETCFLRLLQRRVERLYQIMGQFIREAKLQVEVARLQYMLPRLVGLHAALSRQGGGTGSLSKIHCHFLHLIHLAGSDIVCLMHLRKRLFRDPDHFRIKIVIGLSGECDGVIFVLSAALYRFSRKIPFCGNCACFFVNIFRETAKTKHKMIRSLFLMTDSLKDLITYYKD